MDVDSPRILVVEDDLASQKVARAVLDKLGYVVDIAASGQAAVEAAARFAYSLIFLECQVGEGEGYWAARQIRAGGPSAGAPIIALTITDDAEACYAAGMDGHLRKPVPMSEMARVVDEWLG
jgi:CheY-like chemotaxis protein